MNRRDSCSAELVGRSATSVNHYRCRRACERHSEGRTEVAGRSLEEATPCVHEGIRTSVIKQLALGAPSQGS